jgi:integrase
MKHKLTPGFIANVPAPAEDRTIYWEGSFGLMVTAKGHKSFVVQYRAGRTSRRMSLKGGLSLQEARREAKAILGAVAKGGDPLAEKRKAAAASGNTLKTVAEDYFERELRKLRTGKERKDVFERLVFPLIGTRQIDTIKRSEIVRLLDRIEKENGPHQAQAVLAFLSKLFNWHGGRDDDFVSPIRRDMARTKAKETARDRVLSDDELRAVWRATEATEGAYGCLVRFALLTATRRAEAAEMMRSELQGSDWVVPAARMKAKLEHLIPLSAAAQSVINAMPNLGTYLFTVDGRCPLGGFSFRKARLDEASGVAGWRFHDLRRTARSIMSRAGVRLDIAEKCLAHVPGGVQGTYDRYAYHAEKKQAFEALAAQVERIVNPHLDNVLPMLRHTKT